MYHLFYTRHFLLLACFGALLYAVTKMRLLSDLSVAFAVYGALHALALALALRARQPIWRRALFIAAAAALSVLALRIGLAGMQLLGTLPEDIGLYTALGFSAVTAAITYGILIRLYAIPELTLRSLAVISVGCILAAYAAFYTLAHIHSLGRWLLAVYWWCAFSGGLWYWDYRRNAGTRSPSAA